MSNQKIVYIESPQKALREVPYEEVKEKLIDPVSGKPYKGMILEGIFADLNQTPNNNNRIYDIPEYLKHLKLLKEQIHSSKGVYGELEHPKRYNIDLNYVSHKLLDVWFEPETKLVKGRLIVLNNEHGKKVEQIIRSGGQVAVSARAAGEEIDTPSGVKSAVIKLISTYDIVYHPGFSNALTPFKELNESQCAYLTSVSQQKTGFSLILYAHELPNLSEAYDRYTNLKDLNESVQTERMSCCFLEALSREMPESRRKMIFESQEEQKRDQEIIQKGQAVDEDKKQQELSDAVDSSLSENDQYFQQIKDYQRMMYGSNGKKNVTVNKNKYNRRLRNNRKLGGALFDGSAGFLESDGPSTITGSFDTF